jgi:hypothetical protein
VAIVLAFLLVLNETIEGSNFSRTTVRSLNKARKKLNPSQQLVDHIKAAFPSISREDWGVSITTLDELEFEWEDE